MDSKIFLALILLASASMARTPLLGESSMADPSQGLLSETRLLLIAAAFSFAAGGLICISAAWILARLGKKEGRWGLVRKILQDSGILLLAAAGLSAAAYLIAPKLVCMGTDPLMDPLCRSFTH